MVAKIQEIHHGTPQPSLRFPKLGKILNLQCLAQNVIVFQEKQHWDLLSQSLKNI
jgi:hypothetical protein